MTERVKSYIASIAFALSLLGLLCTFVLTMDDELSFFFAYEGGGVLLALMLCQVPVILLGVVAWRQVPAKLAVACCMVVLLWALSFGLSWGHWDGGFTQTEYEFVFTDLEGNPLEGVELQVVDEHERIAYDYPVDDFRQDRTPRSNKDGILLFHHVNDVIEFGGYNWMLFFLIPIDKGGAPVFHCRFLYENREVHALRYDALGPSTPQGWDSLPLVERTFGELGLEELGLESSTHPDGQERLTFSVVRYVISTEPTVPSPLRPIP